MIETAVSDIEKYTERTSLEIIIGCKVLLR